MKWKLELGDCENESNHPYCKMAFEVEQDGATLIVENDSVAFGNDIQSHVKIWKRFSIHEIDSLINHLTELRNKVNRPAKKEIDSV